MTLGIGMGSLGVLDLHIVTEYTPKVIAGRHTIMGLIHQYSKFVSLPIEEQESLEGHSLYQFSLPVYD